MKKLIPILFFAFFLTFANFGVFGDLATGFREALLNTPDTTGHTRLYYAITEGNAVLAKDLVSKGAKTGMVSMVDGLSALHVAARALNLELVKYFVIRGIRVELMDKNYNTALHHVFLGAKEKDVLNRNSATELRLKTTLSATQLGLGGELIFRGAQIEAAERRAEREYLIEQITEIVKYLVGNAANVNTGGGEVIIKEGRAATETTARTNTKTMANAYPLHLALLQQFPDGFFPIIQYLIKMGANVNHKVEYRDGRKIRYMAPLHVAVKNGRFDLVKLLLEPPKSF